VKNKEIPVVAHLDSGELAPTSFTVVPNVGLSLGTHTATVVVSGENGICEKYSRNLV